MGTSRNKKLINTRFIKPLIKLALNLSLLFGLVFLARYGYQLFTTHPEDPLKGSILLILGVILWIVIVRLTRSRSGYFWLRYKGTKPSFKLTTFSTVAILLILTFASVQPLAGYKDNIVDSVTGTVSEWQEQVAVQEAEREAEKVKEEATRAEQEVTEAIAKTEVEAQELAKAEREAFRLINAERGYVGVPPTEWDDELYKLSMAHTQAMADKKEIFHSPIGASYAECAWGGAGYYRYSNSELAEVLVSSWMSSPLHKAWLLHELLQTSVVSIVVTPDGQYASWTFWMGEAGEGPELINRAARLWEAETGGSIPWLDWLDSKGYPYNTEWLYR